MSTGISGSNIVFKTPSKIPKNYIDYAETGSIKGL